MRRQTVRMGYRLIQDQIRRSVANFGKNLPIMVMINMFGIEGQFSMQTFGDNGNCCHDQSSTQLTSKMLLRKIASQLISCTCIDKLGLESIFI